MNSTEKRLLVLIHALPPMGRNTFTLTAKIGLSYTSTYNYLRVMEAKELIIRVKTGNNKTFYKIRDEGALEMAQSFVEENGINAKNGNL